MDGTTLTTRLAELLDGGGGEKAAGLGEETFLALVTLDSGARCGLDRGGHWVIAPEDGRAAIRFRVEDAYLFHEPLEWKRARFDDAIEAAARAHGLPADDVVFTFPAVEIVRAVLAKKHPYLTRLALEWVRPTELRDLRREIREVTVTDEMPVAVKDLAGRLTVRE